MAVDLGATLGQNINVGAMSHSLALGFYWLLGLTLIGLIVWFIVREIIFRRITFVIRKINGDRSLIFIDNARIVKKNKQALKWRLKRLKINVPIPPEDAVDVTTKGKTFVEAFLTPDEEIVYALDKYDKDRKIGSIYPVKSVDKAFFINEVKEANDRYKTKKISEIIMQMAPIMAVVVIIVVFLVFFDKTVAPTINFGSQLIEASKSVTVAIDSLQTCSQAVTIP